MRGFCEDHVVHRRPVVRAGHPPREGMSRERADRPVPSIVHAVPSNPTQRPIAQPCRDDLRDVRPGGKRPPLAARARRAPCCPGRQRSRIPPRRRRAAVRARWRAPSQVAPRVCLERRRHRQDGGVISGCWWALSRRRFADHLQKAQTRRRRHCGRGCRCVRPHCSRVSPALRCSGPLRPGWPPGSGRCHRPSSPNGSARCDHRHPRHADAPSQQVPSRCTSATTASVNAAASLSHRRGRPARAPG
jgi:hypothetical protein